MQGILNVNKPSGITSAAVVGKIKKHFKLKKVGHFGTLDPMASGVLVLAVGNATRLFNLMQQKVKRYTAVFTFGYETDTLDADGVVVHSSNKIPTKEEIMLACKLQVGKISQLPPIYSAKKVGGSRAYELARSGLVPELKPSKVEIYVFKMVREVTPTSFEFDISCSSGTYIRSLCRDLAHTLGARATMTKLVRTQSGEFNLNNSLTLDDILLKNDAENVIIKLEDVLPYEKIMLTNDEFFKLKNGVGVSTKNADGNYLLLHENSLLGVGVVSGGNLRVDIYLLES